MSASATVTAPQPSQANPPAHHFLSATRQKTILCLLLALLTLVVYNSVVENGFVNFDDNGYITENPHVRAGLTWDTVKWAFTSREYANWHPVTWLSHALDYQLFKLNPAGHHYVNVLLHAANALLLFLLLAGATGSLWPSFMVAALFALHPMNVESVAWAAERKNVLSLFFCLLAFHAYGWYVRKESVRRYALVFALFALGLMAKPSIITLPFVLLLWDYWPLERLQLKPTPDANRPRSFSFLVLEKIPLLFLSAASAAITMVAQKNGNALRDAPLWVRLGNAVVAYMRYIGKAFWPVHLAIPYPHPGRLLPHWQIAASCVALILITGLVLHWRERRYLLVGWFWFLGTLVPVIGLVQVSTQAMADRYAYLPYVGLFICVVWGLFEAARARKIPAPWLGVPAILALIALSLVTRHQLGYWHDSEKLWRHSLSVTQRNYSAHYALGFVLAGQGRVEEAIAEFNAVENLGAYSSNEMMSLGTYEQNHGHVPEAIEQYKKALDIAPDAKSRAAALNRLGLAFMLERDFDRAKLSYGYALREDPQSPSALLGSGLLAQREGDYNTAVRQIAQAVKVEPTDVGYLLLAQALRGAGRVVEAQQAAADAEKISRDPQRARQTVAQVLTSAEIGEN